ncbi:hypothetical protein BT96DRAFT_1005311 [Gymnopus androsaceus JB14]|uniref:Uncharacterized protein n=1 Tax=Gymnopus androsaceus JB14 TaxID=1447944 RepID=A0A6A4GNR5_9AGAR|nr:hypothetical protein BT96DRAFT_1005311 [Gymnopus androsaceus JB14]
MFEGGKAVNSSAVDALLKDKSLVPTRNAFTKWFSEFGTGKSHYAMFVVNLMHEFELGVFKAVFTHLVQIAYALGTQYVDEMNQRFHQCPAFRCDTIWRFTNDTAGMKRLAAHDFEDILQVG